MPQGTVVFYNERAGFGFVREDESKKDVTVHFSGLRDIIRENDRVTFQVVPYISGQMAVDVKRI